VSSYQRSGATGGSALWIGTLVPGLIGLIFALVVVAQANTLLRGWGVPVGFFGPPISPGGRA
jgi:hypothetical protein